MEAPQSRARGLSNLHDRVKLYAIEARPPIKASVMKGDRDRVKMLPKHVIGPHKISTGEKRAGKKSSLR